MLGTIKLDLRQLGAVKQSKTYNRWQIFRDQVTDKEISRINLGIAICRFGHRVVLNRELDTGRAHSGGHNDNHAEEIRAVLSQPQLRPLDGEVADDKPLPKGAHVAVPDRSLSHQVKIPGDASLYVPVIEFGDLVAIERDEMESFRSIRNLMKAYVEAASDAPIARRPISIAVFGAPGSGKSFAVKQIARSINDASNGQAGRLETIEYNVAQFRTVDDLSQAITRIASINNQQKIPLAFFDEFDCSFDGKQLGWLKYFLAPMQDGTFYGASQTITFGRALFVFAGGVSQSLSDFNPYAKPSWRRTDAERKSLDKRREFFRAQKGPDFVSRLRGHIDILSVNPDRTAVKDEAGNPMKPVLRRAFTLRGQIITLGLYTDQDDFKVATVDVDVLYALLTVDKYRHGTRSMEAILQMCTPMEDGMIEKASLPSRAQLNMHVDADEFMARVLRGRFRRFLAPGGVSHSTSVPQLAKVPAQTVTHEQEIDQAAARGDAPPAKQEAPSEAEIRKPRKKSDKKGTQRQESDVRDVESPGEPEA
ncbi:MAG TPA: hypothetical protein VG055_32620 [Planctomycetaceae bacterium]|nr:hypothetical protein [Planctomycetaceae bacterium]